MANIDGCDFLEGNLLLLQPQSNLRTDVISTDDSQKVTNIQIILQNFNCIGLANSYLPQPHV